MTPPETLYAGDELEGDALGEADALERVQARADMRRLVAFELSGEVYGVLITTVTEIREILPVMPLPVGRVPAHVLGLVNLRGNIVPVIDLRRRFGLTMAASTPENRLVVLKGPGYAVALWVEVVLGLARLPKAAFHPAPPGVAKMDAEYYDQVATLNGRMLIELNVPKLLAGTAAQTATDKHLTHE